MWRQEGSWPPCRTCRRAGQRLPARAMIRAAGYTGQYFYHRRLREPHRTAHNACKRRSGVGPAGKFSRPIELVVLNLAHLSRYMDLFVSSRERGLPKYPAPSRFFAMSTLEPAHSRRGQCSADRAGAVPLSKDTGCRWICTVQQAMAGDHKGLLSAIHFCRKCRVLQSCGE
jgi:hypothetical protein